MHLLWPDRPDLPEHDLVQAYPWPDTSARPWVRACMVTTLDGAIAGPDGRSRSISGPADRAVLSAIRSRADAIVVGAGTLRAEAYNPVRTRPELARERVAAGLAPAARLVIVTRSAQLDWSDPVFTSSTVPPLVVTSQAGAAIPAEVDQARLGTGEVDLVGLVAHLHTLGLGRITCEGGPSLLRDMASAGTIDEIDLTLAPLLAGPTGVWAAAPPGHPGHDGDQGGWAMPMGFGLAAVATSDDHLFTRYLRRS